jgi:hypothetical protein
MHTNGLKMENLINNLNSEVTNFLNELNHPFRQEIEHLRNLILTANNNLTENIKWNGPNYCFGNEDRITMRIQPITTKQIQVIFHCGAKVQEQPKEKLIQNNYEFLTWKTNDRAVAAFKTMQDIENGKTDLTKIINEWIEVTK